MNEEELFCKLFPDYAVNGKPLSPYFDLFESGYEQAENRIEELEKENAELKCECKRCVYTDSPCILSDYGKDRNGICDHFKDVFDEIVELNDKLKKWKDEWQEQVQKATDEGYARTLQTIQLTKAKEIIELGLEGIKREFIIDFNGNKPFAKEALKMCNDYCEQAEQFLKDSEVRK